MSMHPRRFFACSGWLLAGLLVLAGGQPVRAQSEGPPAVIEDDPAFDPYVDLTPLGKAWTEKNAAVLADLGLQLAEGERGLSRSHKSISADRVLSMAGKVAAQEKDAKTLDRLARALVALKKTALAATASKSKSGGTNASDGKPPSK